MAGACLSCEKAIIWDNIEIDVLNYEATQIECKNVGDMIKFHRIKLGWSQFRLAEELLLTKQQGRYLIKDYETRGIFPPQELSIKLARLFNLDTKYFYDDYFEFLDHSTSIIFELRKKYKRNKTEMGKLVGVTRETWSRWENGSIISRENYNKINEIIHKKELL